MLFIVVPLNVVQTLVTVFRTDFVIFAVSPKLELMPSLVSVIYLKSGEGVADSQNPLARFFPFFAVTSVIMAWRATLPAEYPIDL